MHEISYTTDVFTWPPHAKYATSAANLRRDMLIAAIAARMYDKASPERYELGGFIAKATGLADDLIARERLQCSDPHALP